MVFPPFYATYIGDGMAIGVNAVTHVIISHGVAIGLVFMIALAEYIGAREGAAGSEEFTGRLIRPAAITITIIGAVTGAGIWFTTTAFAARGIGSMLRLFFWPWLIEWIIFVLEVVGIIILYSKWDAWSGEKRAYRAYYGFAYALFGTLSAFLITGIIAFMLTPDGWPWDKDFWSAFFNPSFLPQAFLRLGMAYALGAMFAMAPLLFMRVEGAFRRRMLRVYGLVLLAALAAVAASAWRYFAVVPSTFKSFAVFAILTSYLSQYPWVFWTVNAAGATVIAALSVAALAHSRVSAKLLVLPAVFAAFCFVAEFESVREFIRGPYIMPGYMYSNQITLEESAYFKKAGLLKSSYWYNLTAGSPAGTGAGEYLFEQNCGVCHTVGGVNDIRKRLMGRPEDGIAVILGHTDEMVPFMPPFSGTEAERKQLAGYLYKLLPKGPGP